jgi:Xaa-Pro aminopeptidase
MTARELGSLLQAKLAEEGGYAPFVYVRNGKDALPPMGASLFPTRNPNAILREGLLLVDMGVSWQGYWSDFSRHYWIGAAPKRAHELNKIEVDAVNAGVKAVKPGSPIGDVYRESMKALRERGIDMSGKMGRIGHGLGLSPCEKPDVLPTGVEIQRGMVFTLEPWIASEFGWFAIEHDMVVTASGCEVLSLATTDLISL